MKSIVIIAIVFLPYCVLGQKLLKPQTDPISNITTWSTSIETLYDVFLPEDIVKYQVIKLSDVNSTVLVMNYRLNGMGNDQQSQSNNTIQMKFADNKIISLNASSDETLPNRYYQLQHMMNADRLDGYYLTFYVLPPDAADELKSADLIFLRITYPWFDPNKRGQEDYTVKSRYAEKLKQSIALIQQAK